MKKVFSNYSEVMHVYAQRTQNEGRSSNVFFYEDKIYSYGYHYLLAEFIDEKSILINDTGYSVTTSKHISQIRQATRQYKQFFKTQTDLKSVLSSVKSDIKKLKNARKPEIYISNSMYLFNKLNEFIEYTKKTDLKKSVEYIEIKFLIDAITHDAKNSIDELLKFEAKKQKIEKRLKLQKEKKQVKDFKNFKIDVISQSENDYLRLNKDKNIIETSQRIKVDINEAKRLLKLIDDKKIIGAKVNDQFIVNSFNGFLKAGCHKIPLSEINCIKKQLETI